MKKEEREKLLKQKLIDMSVYEKELYAKGISTVAGVDEVGRGPLAGPVLAACVVLPADWDIPGLDDSKNCPKKNETKCFRLFQTEPLPSAQVWQTTIQ